MKPLADIAGDNAAHFLTTDRTILAKQVILTSLVGASRLGDSSVDSTHGAALPKDTPVVIEPPSAEYSDKYVLADWKAYVPTGTTLTISYIPA